MPTYPLHQGTCGSTTSSSVKQRDFPPSKALIPISETPVRNPEILTPGWFGSCHLYLCSGTTALAQHLPLRAPLPLFSSKIVFPPFLHDISYLCSLHFWHLCESPLFYRTNHTGFSSHPLGNCCLHPCPSTLRCGEGALPGGGMRPACLRLRLLPSLPRRGWGSPAAGC